MRALLLIVVLGLGGCATTQRLTAPWKVIWADGPWAGPAMASQMEERYYYTSFMADGPTADTRFRSPDGFTCDAGLVHSAVSFLARKRHLSHWPETNASVNRVCQRLAPYTFHLVSIRPAVFVLVPHDFGPAKKRTNSEILTRQSLGDDRLMNLFHPGPDVPSATQLFWFSAELGIDITPVTSAPAGTFVIDHSRVGLIAQPRGAGLHFTRTK